MRVRRYVIVPAIQTPEGEIIPIWDKRIQHSKTQEYGHLIKVNGCHVTYSIIVEAIYDLKKRTLSPGIDIDVYPVPDSLEFTKGEEVYIDIRKNSMKEGVIEDIIYEEFDLEICKGSKIDGFTLKKHNLKNIIPTSLYAIKRWRPTYVLKGGEKIDKYMLKHKA